MAIFKVPRITTAQRLTLTLESSELVFDTDEALFYGGDGTTVGGFLVGAGGSQYKDTFTLTLTDITNKYVMLTEVPNFPATVQLLPDGGIPQRNGIDFSVAGQQVSWDGLGLDNFLEVGDTFTVQY